MIRSLTGKIARVRRSVLSSSSSNRTFELLGVQQVAFGGLSNKPLMNLFHNLLGVEHVSTYKAESENVDEEILSTGKYPFNCEIDLMQPLDATKR